MEERGPHPRRNIVHAGIFLPWEQVWVSNWHGRTDGAELRVCAQPV